MCDHRAFFRIALICGLMLTAPIDTTVFGQQISPVRQPISRAQVRQPIRIGQAQRPIRLGQVRPPVPIGQPLQQLGQPLESQSPARDSATLATPLLAVPVDLSSRIKDITKIEGHRYNHVLGVGLVTGLSGTGGNSVVTKNFAQNFLKIFDTPVKDVPTANLSVVAVNAEIPAFARAGETIRVTVSVFDDATGLYGGQLQPTALKASDGVIYAVAKGAVTVGGFSASGAGGRVSKNHITKGKAEATIELTLQQGPAFPDDFFNLLLTNKDATTAYRIAAEINRYFPGHAVALDEGGVQVAFPNEFRRHKMDFVVMVNNLRVTPDMAARVVIDQATGTIVFGHNVRLSKVVFANDNLIITTNENPVVAQPAPRSNGATVILPRTQLTAIETGGRYNVINQQTTVAELAAALNALGVSPQDLISIFKTIEATGALQATIISL